MSYRVINLGYLNPGNFPLINYSIDYKLVYEAKRSDRAHYADPAVIMNLSPGMRIACI